VVEKSSTRRPAKLFVKIPSSFPVMAILEAPSAASPGAA
jgi:hypothetical protein